MEVDRVKVSLRYAQLLANGNWKTVELEASGTVSPKETWQQAQAYLYAELERQVMEVFKLPEAKLEPAEVRYTPPPESWIEESGARAAIRGELPGQQQPSMGLPETQGLGHWCVIHAQQFERHQSKTGGQTWYSHKIEGTDAWCRE